MSPDSLIIVVGIPDKALSPNARGHWSRKAKAAKHARHDARWLAAEAWQRVAPRHDAPKWDAARIDVALPVVPNSHRRDARPGSNGPNLHTSNPAMTMPAR